ncbi:MAG TPA: diguanylate cyclase [Burkholderiales bacterium]|nr:diguanylate cyclase [Burkholderiales bacterium]
MRKTAHFALGAALALAGVALVEALLLLGLSPLSPVAYPGLGMLAGAALGGVAGCAGGVIVLGAYYLLNAAAAPERFPHFFSGAYSSVAWAVALALIALAVVAFRSRLLRMAAAETELAARRQYEEALRESEAWLRIITDNIPAMVSYIDAEERYRFNNRAYEQLLGKPRSQVTGHTVREVWGEARYTQFKPNIERALRGERVTHDYAARLGGNELRLLATYVPDRDVRGRVKGFFVLASDITALAATRDELRAAHERLEAALDGSNVALWDTDLRSGRVYLGEAWARIVDAPPRDSVATTDELLALVHPADVDTVRRASLEVMKGLRPLYAVEHRVKSRNGEWRWILSRGRVTERDPAGRALRMIGTNLDITERRRAEEAMQSIAQTDALTGLANRRMLGDRLRVALARNRRSGMESAVLYLDIDRFKDINDTLGHPAGDAVLAELARRLAACVRASDTVARFGGDEFVVLLEDLRERHNAVRIAEKILEEARRPVRVEVAEVLLTVSVGLAYSDGASTDEDLLRRADAALYEAKTAGRNRFRIAA